MNKDTQKRLRALMRAHADENMTAAIREISPRSYKALATAERSEAAAEGANKLYEILRPLGEEAYKSMGVPTDDAVNFWATEIVGQAVKRWSRWSAEDYMDEEEDDEYIARLFRAADDEEDDEPQSRRARSRLFRAADDEEDEKPQSRRFRLEDYEEDFEEDDELMALWGAEGDDLYGTDDEIYPPEEDVPMLRASRSRRARFSLAPDDDDMDLGDDYVAEDDIDFDDMDDVDEEMGGMLGARRSRMAAPRGLRNPRYSMSRDAADVKAQIKAEVKKAMKSLPAQKGRNAIKNVNVNVLGNKPRPGSLVGFLRNVRDKNFGALRASESASKAAYKALGVTPATGAGYLVPIEQSNQVIELLRAKSIFMRSPSKEAPLESLITVMPMASETMLIPRQTDSSNAYWVAENNGITPSQPQVGQIQLVAKKLAVLIKVSNELMEDSSEDIDQFLRTDMAEKLSREIDRVILYGDGTNGEPLGVLNTTGVYKSSLSSAAPGVDDLTSLISNVEQADVDLDDSARWVLHPRDKNAFRLLQDGAGQFIFAGVGLNAAVGGVPEMLLGYPWVTSTTVAKVGTPSETDIFFGRWRDVILGMRKSIEIAASQEAGDAFAYDQTWLRAIMRVDIALRHPEGVGILTDAREVALA